MVKKEIIVEKSEKMHSFLQNYGFSFVDVNKMLRNKDVKLNGKPCKENVLLQVGDEIVFYYKEEALAKKYEKIYETDDVLIVYKSAGIESAGENGLEAVLGVIAVHRLDRNTEGLMVFAKNQGAKDKLEKAFKKQFIHKFYVAEVVGKFETDKVYGAFLVKDRVNSMVKIYQNEINGAVPIKTRVRTLKVNEQSSLLELELLTGKTHQIRAHLAFLGHPIIGDGKYGKNEINKKFKQNRQKLCCFRLEFDNLGLDSLNGKVFKKNPKWVFEGLI
ncbi:MAG: RluA family pseudouridine synthase [Clostridia bacterium]|nr:RluA family pseudouridine synthase [Clostridia bacterium]